MTITEKQKELHKKYGGTKYDPMIVTDRNVCLACGHWASHYDYCVKKQGVSK